MDLVLNAVQTGHHHRGEGQIRALAVESGKRTSMRRPFGLLT
jgi:hypothetical protein